MDKWLKYVVADNNHRCYAVIGGEVMEQLQKFSEIYDAYVEEYTCNDFQGTVLDDLPKERRRFSAFLYSLGIQPESFKYPSGQYDKNTSYARFAFNADGRDFLMQYFRQRKSVLYKDIRRKRFSPAYYKEYENMSKQIASNMYSLGHNESLIRTQIDHFWLTIARNQLFDFLPGLRGIDAKDILGEYQEIIDDSVSIDLLHISRALEEDYRRFQKLWRLSLKLFLHERQQECKNIENQAWFTGLSDDLAKLQKESQSVKFEDASHLINELKNAKAEKLLDAMASNNISILEDVIPIVLVNRILYDKECNSKPMTDLLSECIQMSRRIYRKHYIQMTEGH